MGTLAPASLAFTALLHIVKLWRMTIEGEGGTLLCADAHRNFAAWPRYPVFRISKAVEPHGFRLFALLCIDVVQDAVTYPSCSKYLVRKGQCYIQQLR